MKGLALLVALGLAACTDPHEHLSADFGNSVRANIAAQVVNPGPNLSAAPDETDAQRIGNAMRRYRSNTVYPPHPYNGAPFSSIEAPAAASAPAPY